jgi:hypothetical protein
MGAIAVETRTIERIVPADPANASSMEQKIMEAGQVSALFFSIDQVLMLISLVIRSGTQTQRSKLLKPFSISTEKVYLSSSLLIGEDFLEDNRICSMRFSNGSSLPSPLETAFCR